MTKIRFVVICFLLCLVFPAKVAISSVGNVGYKVDEPIIKNIIIPQKKPIINLKQDSGDRQIKKRKEMIDDLINKDLVISSIKGLDNEQKQSALCLAMNIYNEARNSSTEDMIGVSLTVFSRLNSGRYVNKNAQNNVCNVIFADHQYSWTNHSIALPKEKNAWVKSQTIAFLLITDVNIKERIKRFKYKHYVLTSLFESTTDKWFNQAKSTKIIGAHTYLLFEDDNTNSQSELAVNLISYIRGRLSSLG